MHTADTILIAAGMRANREIADAYYNAALRVFKIGDCVRPSRVAETVNQGHYRALDI